MGELPGRAPQDSDLGKLPRRATRGEIWESYKREPLKRAIKRSYPGEQNGRAIWESYDREPLKRAIQENYPGELTKRAIQERILKELLERNPGELP